MTLDSGGDYLSSLSSNLSSKVYQSFIIRSNHSKLTERDFRLASIVKLNGGGDDLVHKEEDFNEKDMEKLVHSIIAIIDQNLYKEISINKLFKKMLKSIEPVVLDKRFWQIVAGQQNLKKSELDKFSEVDRSTDILNPTQSQKIYQS